MMDRMMDHETRLTLSARAESAAVTAVAEALLPQMPEIEVVENRTGLVMLPMRDTVTATDFHLGEVLVSEAHIRAGDAIGYGMRTGRDLEAAMAMAVIDLAAALDVGGDALAAFFTEEAAAQATADQDRMRDVEATRVRMETF